MNNRWTRILMQSTAIMLAVYSGKLIAIFAIGVAYALGQMDARHEIRADARTLR